MTSPSYPPAPNPHPIELPRIHPFPADVQLFLNAIPDVTVIVVLGLSLVFTVYYRSLFNWRKTRPGRALAIVSLGVAEILFLATTTALFGTDYPFRWLIRELIFIHVGIGMFLLIRALWIASRERPDDAITLTEPRRRTGPIRIHKEQP